jgi:hypothetical protein
VIGLFDVTIIRKIAEMLLFSGRPRLRSRGPLGRRERKNGGCSSERTERSELSEANFAVLAPKAVKGRRAAKARSFVSFPSWEKKKGKCTGGYTLCKQL